MESSGSSTGKVKLPAGVSISAGRETTMTNAQGAVVQGMQYTLTLGDGTTTGIFVPYSEVHDIPKVQAIIDRRVNALQAISG